jgi:hypothetical protein
MSEEKDKVVLNLLRGKNPSELDTFKRNQQAIAEKLQKQITEINERVKAEKAPIIRKKNAADHILTLVAMINAERNSGRAPETVNFTAEDIDEILGMSGIKSPDFKVPKKK